MKKSKKEVYVCVCGGVVEMKCNKSQEKKNNKNRDGWIEIILYVNISAFKHPTQINIIGKHIKLW